MGSYLNPRPQSFWESLNSKIYVDKTGLIDKTNEVLRTQQKYVCVSRPRRFGKSMALNMLAAYYTAGQDTHELFDGLKISQCESYEENINKYNVIRVSMQEFVSMTSNVDEALELLQKNLFREIKRAYRDFIEDEPLVMAMKDVYAETGKQFVVLVDEWDCLFREYADDKESQKKYLDFLRLWLKDQDYVALAYMTGILPIKKYGTHSALNMFTEYSMTSPGEMAEYFGFTEDEVQALCSRFRMSYEETKAWYNGYELTYVRDFVQHHMSIYNPKAVVEAMTHGLFGNYWNKTETYEALKVYIQLNIDGLKDAVIKMLTGERITIDSGGFINDMNTFSNRDDVLTLLIHLGYLSYHWDEKSVSIPNKEVAQEYVTSITRMDGWKEVARSVEDSRLLLKSLWELDGDTVAQGIDRAHNEISILKYNDENSLSCAIHLAFYFAREYYTIIREFPSGKGFADVVYIPRKAFADKPAIVAELKYNQSAEGAIAQIKEKGYCESLKDYHGNLILCGINYDKETKTHSCVIEKLIWNENGQ